MALSKEPTEDELKEFRTINGIPEKPEGYDLKFDNGLVIGDEDKPVIDNFLKQAHEAHMHPDQVKKAVSWYYSELERQAEEQDQRDAQIKSSTEDELRSEFGDKYRHELSLIKNTMAGMFPKDDLENIITGRTTDGIPLGSHKGFLMAMSQLAHQINPMGTLTGVEGADPMKSITERINEIKNVMRTDKNRYKREKMDQELMDLTKKQKMLKGRAA